MSDLSSNILPNFVVQCYHCYSFFSFNQITAIPFGVSCQDFPIILTCFRWAVQGSPFSRTDQMGLLCPPLQQYVNFVLQFTNKGFIWFTFSLFLWPSGSLLDQLQAKPHSESQTVVVENPMSVDESGKLVWFLANSFSFSPSAGPSPVFANN